MKPKTFPVPQPLQRLSCFYGAHSYLLCIAFLLLYRLTLDILYCFQLSRLYAYSAVDNYFVTFEPLRYASSWLAVLLAAPFVAALVGQRAPSSRLLSLINLCYFLPLTCYFGLHGADIRFFITALLFWGLLLFWQLLFPHFHFRPLPLKHLRPVTVALTAFFCAVVLYISGKYAHFRLFFDISNVYGVRAEAAQYDISGPLSYSLSLAPIVLALLLLFYLGQRKYLLCGGICVVYLFLFSIAGNKSTFLFLFLLLASFLCCREWMYSLLPGLLGGAALFSAVWFALTEKENIIGNLFFRRMMFVPVHLSQSYYRFFSAHPLNLSRDGILHWFSFSPVYSTSIPRLIGEYLESPGMNGNNGLLGDLFANFPIPLGLLLLPLILIICFRLLDLCAHGLPAKIVLPICVYFMVVFQDTLWSTALLSAGFLPACLILYFFPREEAPHD